MDMAGPNPEFKIMLVLGKMTGRVFLGRTLLDLFQLLLWTPTFMVI